MTTAFCSTCGAPLSGPFCTQCGTAAPKPLFVDETIASAPPPPPTSEVEATMVRSTPLVPASVEMPPHPTMPPASGPEPTIGIPPLYASPIAPAPQPKRDRTKIWLALGAVIALIAGALSVWFFALRDSTQKPAPAASATTAARASATASVSATAPSPAGTRAPQVPAWANKNVGRQATPQIVLGGGGSGIAFGSKGGNQCGASGPEVVCAAADFWTRTHSLPTGPECVGTQVTHPLSLFWIRSDQTGSALRCTTIPPALQQTLGTVPDNQVIGMGHTGVLCLVDHVSGESSKTGLACWNPLTNHGFMITAQDKRVW